jgi:hypothetical protein
MRGLVVYESMFGSTRLIAEAIADGLGDRMPVRVVRAAEVRPEDLTGLDCLVVGAPTHVHGLPRPSTRQGARGYLDKPENDLALEPGADSDPGVREWLDALPTLDLPGAAFDTRVHGSAMVTGRASRSISRALVGYGMAIVLPPESFLVDKHNQLMAGEIDRARSWGVQLSTAVFGRAPAPA